MKAMSLRLANDIYHGVDFIRKDVDALVKYDYGHFVEGELLSTGNRGILREAVASVMAAHNSRVIGYDTSFAMLYTGLTGDEFACLDDVAEAITIIRNGSKTIRTMNLVSGLKTRFQGIVYPVLNQWTLSERKECLKLIRSLRNA